VSRPSVTIPFNPVPLKAALIERQWTLEMVGDFFGISRQAVNAWFSAERIPPRRLIDLAEKLNLPSNLVEQVVDKQDSVKDYAREVLRLREENEKLKAAIGALIGDMPSGEGEK
jgi:hypothetical protein